MQLPQELEEWIYKHRTTVSAGSASFVATILGFPLDSVKSRLQVSKYTGVVDCVKKTYRYEGFQGFFRGLTMPLLTITLVRTVSFTIYSETKKYFADKNSVWLNPDTLKGKAALGFLGGATSGLLLSTGTCAFELVKVRSQLEYLISKKRGVPYAPQGTISGALLVYRENGFRGLYFGYSLHTLRDTLGTSLYFTSYDSLRYLLDEKRNNFGIPPTLIPFICGSTCGIGSWFIVYPIDLVKTRVQRDALSGVQDRPSAMQVFKRLRKGGIARLYKGLGVSASRSALTHGSLWLMLKLEFFRSYVSSAAQAVLAKGNSVPGLPAYQLGERKHEYDGHSIWSLHEGVKRDDSTPISVFIFDSTPSPSTGGRDRRSLLPLARNALRKLRSLRHPDVLRFIDGHETETAVYIVTEAVSPLTARIGTEGQQPGQGEEWKVWGLSRIVTALRFINTSGASTHGNLRPSSIFTSPSGEWKLGGFEVLSTLKDASPVLYSQGGLLPDSGRFSSPEVRKSGWDVLKDLDPSALDSYQLYLLIYILFNGPLPTSFISDPSPSLPTTKGGIPQSIFPSHRRLGNPNPRARLKIDAFWEIGNGNEGGTGQQGAGFFKSNRLVKLAEGLEGFALASEGERAALVRTIKDASESLPPEFVMYKVLPSLVKAFEFGPGGPSLLPLILTLGNTLPQADYTSSIVQPLIRMYATPDRAMRMALLEGLPSYAEKLDQKLVTDKIWPHLVTGFTDVVPVIREATVKSILLIAPKLTDRILNNDLLRYLAKTQTDTEAGIRTNTCILLGRLSKHLQSATARKVLVPAFARALRDPFVHARIAGLMSLMATVDVYEKEDLAGRVIPAMSICLVDKEKTVRLQAFKAIDMFIKRTEQLTANMPDTVLPPDDQQQGTSLSPNTAVAGSKGQPGLAESAGGAAVALAGWAFTSLSSRIASSELTTPMLERRASTPSAAGSQSAAQIGSGLGTSSRANTLAKSTSALQGQQRSASQPNLPDIDATGTTSIPSPRSSLAFGNGSIEDILDSDPMAGSGDWGGDLIDVAADEGDFDDFESAQPVAPPAPAEPVSYPRYTITRPAASTSTAKKPMLNGKKVSSLGGGSAARATGASKVAASVLREIEAEEGLAADWSFDGDAQDSLSSQVNDDGWGAETEEASENTGYATPKMSGSATLSSSTHSTPASNTGTATPPPASSASIAKDKLAQMKEERKARLAAAKEKRAASALEAK